MWRISLIAGKSGQKNTSFSLQVSTVLQYFNASRCIDSTYSYTATNGLEDSEALIFGLSIHGSLLHDKIYLFYFIFSLIKVDK